MARDPFAPRKPLLLRVIYWAAVVEVVAGSAFALWSAGSDLFAETVVTHMPVGSFWPALTPSVKLDPPPTASVAAGGFELANVSLTGVGLDARVWLAAAQLLQGTMAVTIGVAIAILTARLLRGDPFGRVLSRTAFAAAAAIGVGGILWQVCSGIGGNLVSAQVLTVTGWTIDDEYLLRDSLNEIGWPPPAYGFSIDFWPIGAALAIVAIGVAFLYGETLQADIERLRTQKRGLQGDTEGLV